MTLTQTLQNFRDSIVFTNRLIASAHTTDLAGNNLWANDEISFITESSFLKMFIAWESFLEKSFILYLTGNPSTSGNLLAKYADPVDQEHAHKMLMGVMRYVDWTTPETVRKFANLYFDSGEPYQTTLNSINADLLDLKTIRNAAAHLSTTTTQQLDILANRKLGILHTGISVYDLLTSNNPTLTGKTILQSYQDVFDTAANLIANA